MHMIVVVCARLAVIIPIITVLPCLHVPQTSRMIAPVIKPISHTQMYTHIRMMKLIDAPVPNLTSQTNHSSFASTMAQACTLLAMRVGPSSALLLQKKQKFIFQNISKNTSNTNIVVWCVRLLQIVRCVRAQLHVRLRATSMQVLYPHNACRSPI